MLGNIHCFRHRHDKSSFLSNYGTLCRSGCCLFWRVHSFPTVKPIDKDVIKECSEKFGLIVTVEEHNLDGGFGSAVAEVLCELPKGARLHRIGVPNAYADTVGDQSYLRRYFGLDAESIASVILKEVGE